MCLDVTCTWRQLEDFIRGPFEWTLPFSCFSQHKISSVLPVSTCCQVALVHSHSRQATIKHLEKHNVCQAYWKGFPFSFQHRWFLVFICSFGQLWFWIWCNWSLWAPFGSFSSIRIKYDVRIFWRSRLKFGDINTSINMTTTVIKTKNIRNHFLYWLSVLQLLLLDTTWGLGHWKKKLKLTHLVPSHLVLQFVNWAIITLALHAHEVVLLTAHLRYTHISMLVNLSAQKLHLTKRFQKLCKASLSLVSLMPLSLSVQEGVSLFNLLPD